MTPSKVLLFFCLSFIGGVFVGSFFAGNTNIAAATNVLSLFLLAVLILGIFLISVFWDKKNFVLVGFCVLFLVAGVWRYQLAELRVANDELRKLNDSGQVITLEGIVAKEPDLRERSQRLTVKVADSNVLVTTWRYPEYKYGDKLQITGKLKAPPILEDFNYRDYLKKDGIYSQMSWPEIDVVGKGFSNPLTKTLFAFKSKFKETVRSFIPSPELGILEALVFGDENNISKTWKDKLNFTGTRHIAAVSGMNITIISALLLNLLLLLGFRRSQAFYLSILLIIIYILMIGAPASAVRAGIMGGLFLTAQHVGRLSTASRAVSLAAALMLAFNPFLLRLDVGFQLSFLAMMGLIHLQPVFSDFLRKIPNPKLFPARATLSATLSAQVFTLPILIYNFSYVSLVSPATNILIVPFLAPITILIFLFGLAAMLFFPLGLILSFPTWLSLAYIVKIVDLFSKIPAAAPTLNISWIWLVIFYALLVFATYKLQERQRLKFLQY